MPEQEPTLIRNGIGRNFCSECKISTVQRIIAKIKEGKKWRYYLICEKCDLHATFLSSRNLKANFSIPLNKNGATFQNYDNKELCANCFHFIERCECDDWDYLKKRKSNVDK